MAAAAEGYFLFVFLFKGGIRQGVRGLNGCEEGKDADDRVSQVLGKDVHHVFRTCQACLDECKTRLHEEDKTTSDEHPDVVEDRLDL